MKPMIHSPIKIILVVSILCLITTSVYLTGAGASDAQATFTVQ